MVSVTLIPGDGVGPEIAEVVRVCVDELGVGIKWDVQEAGEHVFHKEGNPLPDRILRSIRKNKVAIKGPVTTPIGKGFRSVNVRLRQALELYACLRPCKLYKGVPGRFDKVDLVVVRENMEDLYAGIEFEKGKSETKKLAKRFGLKNDVAISIKPISQKRSSDIITFAYEYAKKNNRKKITTVHKANIMKFSDGLFLKTAERIGKKNNSVDSEDRIIDNMCMQLVINPENFDVIVTENLYGDILSDLCAGLVGGLGMAPGANIGKKYAVFEATHGSAPKYAGKNVVNPCGMLLSAVMMLNHLGMKKAAKKLEHAIAEVIAEGKYVTYDLRKDRKRKAAGTKQMGNAIVRKLQ